MYIVINLVNDTNLWRFCPEGYICGEGTDLTTMNNNKCSSGKFCTSGMQNIKNAKDCPPGRFCGEATAVGSQEQIQSCNYEDPNYCYIGDICLSGYFCKNGTTGTTDYNSCFNLTSFAGARDRFFCSRTLGSITKFI
jgi:hypothetical protein